MPKYIIERDMADVGKLSDIELAYAAQKSCDVLRAMGPGIQWVQSYVTANKLYAVYIADSEELIREHAERSGFPASRISKVDRILDPATAELKGHTRIAA